MSKSLRYVDLGAGPTVSWIVAPPLFKCGILCFVALGSVLSWGMPTKKELKEVEPVVLELMDPELKALKAGTKKMDEVALAANVLADQAESEAARLLLMRGAVDFYSRAGEEEQAIELLKKIKFTIKDIPDDELLKIAEDAVRSLTTKGNVTSLRSIVAELKIRSQASMWLAKFKKQLRRSPNDTTLHLTAAEAYVALDDWASALKEFAKAGPGIVKGVKANLDESEKPEVVADFWWTMSDNTKERVLQLAYRRRAVEYYQKALAGGALNGLLKMRAERRSAETSEASDICAFLRGDLVHDSVIKTYILDLNTSGPCLQREKVKSDRGADIFKTEKILLERIPEGQFRMGVSGEAPHSVKISRPFWAGVHLVTFAQWGRLMKSQNLSPTQKALGGDKAAVSRVTRQAIDDFCRKLTEKAKGVLPAGYVFRLPTLAENEYMLLAGAKEFGAYQFSVPSTTPFRLRHGVCEEGKKEILAKQGIVLEDKYWQVPANYLGVEVGLREPNAWGLYDCWGNVDQFMLDVFPKDTTSFVKGVSNLPWKEEEDPFFWDEAGVGGCSIFFKDTRKAVNPGWMYLRPNGAFQSLGFRLVLAPDLVTERNSISSK